MQFGTNSHQPSVILVSQLGIEIHKNPPLWVLQRAQTLSISILGWFRRMEPAESRGVVQHSHVCPQSQQMQKTPGPLQSSSQLYPWLTSCAVHLPLITQRGWLGSREWAMRQACMWESEQSHLFCFNFPFSEACTVWLTAISAPVIIGTTLKETFAIKFLIDSLRWS